jgi:hypothetical protein
MPLNYAKEGIMSEWTTEPPKADGAYWLSITPEKRPSPSGRNDFPPVVKCYIQTYRANALYIGSPAGPLVKYDRGGDWLSLDQDWFNGAQWKLVDPDPVDPFAEPPPNYSRDSDLP